MKDQAASFFYGLLFGGFPPLVLWVYSAGKWREEINNMEDRLARLENIMNSFVSSILNKKAVKDE